MSAKAEYKVMTGDEVVILAGEHRERKAQRQRVRCECKAERESDERGDENAVDGG